MTIKLNNKDRRLISNTEGEIKSLLFFIPSWLLYPEIRNNDKKEVTFFLNTYKKIFSLLQVSVELNIVTHKIAKIKIVELVKQLKLKNKVRYIFVENDLEFSLWSQDAFCIGFNSANIQMLKPAFFRRLDDEKLVQTISQKTKIQITQLDFFFQGGNILVGDNFWFVGGNDLLKEKRKRKIILDQTLIDKFTTELEKNKRLIPIYSSRKISYETKKEIYIDGELWTEILHYGNTISSIQPIFHIDMFITLIERNKNGKYVVLVGDSNLEKYGVVQAQISSPLNEIFDDIANKLSILDFEVIRNPLPYISLDDKIHKVRKWYYATYNNVVVQNQPKIVFLPTYFKEKEHFLNHIDRYNINLWKRLGYKVNKVPNFHKFTQNFGAMNCITKVLNRN